MKAKYLFAIKFYQAKRLKLVKKLFDEPDNENLLNRITQFTQKIQEIKHKNLMEN